MNRSIYFAKVLKYAVLVLLVVFLWGSHNTDVQAAPTSGQCGDNVYWEYDDATKTLTISGTGDIKYRAWFTYTESIEKIVVEDGITKIFYEAFSEHINVKQIVLPDSLTEIEASAFSGCKSLESITIPQKIERIYARTFSGCSALKTITLPQNLERIDYLAFSGCSSLEAITIPNGVKQIGVSVFEDCSGLKYLEFPRSVEELFFYYGFNSIEPMYNSGCTNLEKITILNPECEIGSMGFGKDVIICGYENSTAQKYAEAQGMELVVTTVKYIPYGWILTFVGVLALAGGWGVFHYRKVKKEKLVSNLE